MFNISKLKEEQVKLSSKVIIKDSFKKIKTVAGIDFAYSDENVICAIVVCDYKDMKEKETTIASAKAPIPYISGFLAYRNGPAISEAYSQLKQKPDVIIFNGNGILHPRRFGLASHMGVVLDCPSIGIAKELMTGEEKDGVVYVDKEARAQRLITREKAKPVYVSPGHKISLKSSVEIVMKCMRFPHKLPEPLHLAHKLAKEKLKEIDKNKLV